MDTVGEWSNSQDIESEKDKQKIRGYVHSGGFSL